ncbi:MAG: alpha-D-ribose 1-methylphosphonate 5-triphosphate diphosphatase [Rhodobacteraceae bacterium]|nr:alpha-D-ribose 1-methylphosphonate 5-triphosphate diphosphatase [Paracoccaceae bacterium]
MLDVTFLNGEVLRQHGPRMEVLSLSGGRIVEHRLPKRVDLDGYMLLPGIIDAHGDGFERHVAPRRGAMKQIAAGVMAAEAELAANGITTAVLAQFYSWEGGVRGPEFAGRMMAAVTEVRPQVATDLIPQLRFEYNMLYDYAELPRKIADWNVPYVVFNDHLPHDRLASRRRPKGLTGQALRAGRDPEKHFAMLLDMHACRSEVPQAMDQLCRALNAAGVRLGSHDDPDADTRAKWRARGVRISEFPETLAVAVAARGAGDHIILGAPNVVRGGSHKGNASALELIAMGFCDALASDYHYPSPKRAAFVLADGGVCGLAEAWSLISSGPARVLGLSDRGDLEPGLRADLVILDKQSRHVAATIAAGRVSFMSGPVASRFLAA